MPEEWFLGKIHLYTFQQGIQFDADLLFLPSGHLTAHPSKSLCLSWLPPPPSAFSYSSKLPSFSVVLSYSPILRLLPSLCTLITRAHVCTNTNYLHIPVTEGLYVCWGICED